MALYVVAPVMVAWMAASIGRQCSGRAAHNHQNRVTRNRARTEATSEIPMDQRAAGLIRYLRASIRRTRSGCGADGLRAVPAHAVGMAMRWVLRRLQKIPPRLSMAEK